MTVRELGSAIDTDICLLTDILSIGSVLKKKVYFPSWKTESQVIWSPYTDKSTRWCGGLDATITGGAIS